MHFGGVDFEGERVGESRGEPSGVLGIDTFIWVVITQVGLEYLAECKLYVVEK